MGCADLDGSDGKAPLIINVGACAMLVDGAAEVKVPKAGADLGAPSG